MGYAQRLPQIKSIGVAHILELVSKCAGDGYVLEAVDPVAALVYPVRRSIRRPPARLYLGRPRRTPAVPCVRTAGPASLF
jgi:hypothetical protein